MRVPQTAQRTAAFFLYATLICVPLIAQVQAPASRSPKAILVDPRRAQSAIERGDNAVAEGRVDDALAAYDEAARFAPQDATVLGRGALLRAKIVGEHADRAGSR